MARRRKYRFKDRAEAEQQYEKADRQRLLAEWLLSAILDKRNVTVGRADDFTVGYVALRHTCFVYAIRNRTDSIHRISGIWDSDSTVLAGIIRQQCQYHDDGREFGLLLERAKTESFKATITENIRRNVKGAGAPAPHNCP